MSLYFTFPNDPTPYQLNAVTANDGWPASSLSLHLKATKCIHDQKHKSKVYHAEYIPPDEPTERDDELPSQMTCKFVQGAEAISKLRTEVGFYNGQLRDCQGRTVPRFFGLFRGVVGDELLFCSVMEYCGKPLSTAFEDASWPLK